MNRNVFITGASSGIGKAIATYLTEQGCRVIGTARRLRQDFDGPFELIPLEVTDDVSVQHACELALDRLRRIDVLINNAGYGLSGPIEDTDIAAAKEQFDVNYFGVVRTTNALLPHFRANRAGTIINISSLGGLISLPFQAHYSASKYALEGYTEALRMELKPFGIQVCNVNPGDFNTAFTEHRKIVERTSEEYMAAFERFLAMYENDERNGSSPLLVARLVARLIQEKRLKVRYTVGKPSQTIGVGLKRWLGPNLFEEILTKVWPVR